MEEIETIRVLIKEPYKKPYIKLIENKYENFKEIVGGYIECVEMPGMRNVDLFVNEEGKLDKLPGNFWLPEYDDVACGTCYMVGFDPETGDNVSLTDNQINKCLKYISNYELMEGLYVYSNYDLLNAYIKVKFNKLKKQSEM